MLQTQNCESLTKFRTKNKLNRKHITANYRTENINATNKKYFNRINRETLNAFDTGNCI